MSVNPFLKLVGISAKHPIEVVMLSLLFSSIAYISIMKYYFQEWELLFKRNIVPVTYDPNQLIRDCTHFYYDINQKDSQYENTSHWKEIDYNELDNYKSWSHYYLYTYIFQNSDPDKISAIDTDINSSKDMIYEFQSTKFFLKTKLLEPMENLQDNSDSNVTWELGTTKSYLRQLSSKFVIFWKNFIVQNNLEQTDITLLLLSYLMVLGTIFDLIRQMRLKGSKFWMSLTTLISAACSFFLALFTMVYLLNKPTTTLTIFEILPFFLVIVGFRDKIRFTDKVIKRYGTLNISRKITVDKIICDSFSEIVAHLLRYYLSLTSLIFFIIMSFTNSNEVTNCLLTFIFILFYDIILTSTFYSAILALKLEIKIINRSTTIRQALEEECDVTIETQTLNEKLGLPSFHFFQSTKMILFGKLSIISLLIGINIYNINIVWVYNTLISLILSFKPSKLPDFILHDDGINSSLSKKKGIIISVVPTLYYQSKQSCNNSENITMLLLRLLGYIISDKFIGKLIFIICVISITTNVYLLRVAKFHSDATISQYYKKNTSNNKNDSGTNVKLDHLIRPPHPQDHLTRSLSSATFSLNSSDDDDRNSTSSDNMTLSSTVERSLDDSVKMMVQGKLKELRNTEIANMVIAKKLPLYSLEQKLEDRFRAVEIRREAISALAKAPTLNTTELPYENYDYDRVFGSCCENVVGYIPLPLGIMGPLIVDGISYHVPMATTEGCLVASATRGCKAINAGGGATTILTRDGMTRGPCVRFSSLLRSGACKLWLDSEEGQANIKKAFDSTSRFARLQHIKTALAGDLLFIRFMTTTGDAMGMNMISKGVEHSLAMMIDEYGFEDMEIISLSGNYCTDKKPAAINWIEGRGKSVYAEAIIPGEVVSRVLKCTSAKLAELNVCKNLIGSAMAGSVGGFNAHAANTLTAIFLALGQDPAQNIESSNCITLMDEIDGNLKISVSMPSIEVGTIGGGTVLGPQGVMLDLLGVRGPNQDNPGENARLLAKIIACSVMAAELSLCAALATGQLVKSHLIHNRKEENSTK